MLSPEAESWICRHAWKLAAVAVAVCVAGLWLAYGWWVRPPAVEYDNLRYVQLLSTAISARNEVWLSKVEEAVAQRHQTSEMSDRERQAFDRILVTASNGEWKQAERDCFRLAEAQLNRRRSKPDNSKHEQVRNRP